MFTGSVYDHTIDDGDKVDANNYAPVWPVTKSYHFMKPSAENFST
ncbi:hypothetical protein AVEN_242964-1, partial [Araneus ventricosus]